MPSRIQRISVSFKETEAHKDYFFAQSYTTTKYRGWHPKPMFLTAVLLRIKLISPMFCLPSSLPHTDANTRTHAHTHTHTHTPTVTGINPPKNSSG